MTVPKVVLAVLLVTVLLLPAFSRGVRVSSDGVHYTWIAEMIAKGDGFKVMDDSFAFMCPMIHPPGYGVLLAPFRVLQIPRKESVILLNALALLVIFFLTLSLMRDRLSEWGAMAAAALVTASPALAGSALHALTEVTFTALVVALVWSVIRGKMWLAAILAFFVCGVRYNGLTVVLAVALTLPRWRDRLLVALPSSVTLLAGVLASGAYKPFLFTKAFAPKWGSIAALPSDMAKCAGGFVVLVALIYAAWKMRKWPVAAAGAGYYFGLVAASPVFGSYVTGERLQAPGTALLLIAMFYVLHDWHVWRRIVMIGLAVTAFDGYMAHWKMVRRENWTLMADPVHGVAVASRMAKVPVSQIYSNAPDYIWYHTGMATKITPAPESAGTLPPTARVFFLPLTAFRKDSRYHRLNEYGGVAEMLWTFTDSAKMLKLKGSP